MTKFKGGDKVSFIEDGAEQVGFVIGKDRFTSNGSVYRGNYVVVWDKEYNGDYEYGFFHQSELRKVED